MKSNLRNALFFPLFLLTAAIFCSCSAGVPTEFTVRYGVSGVGGSIWGEKKQTVAQGEDAKPVSVSADAGFYFAGWEEGGEISQTSPVHRIYSAEESADIKAVFTQVHDDIPLICVNTKDGAKITSKEEYLPCRVTVSDPENPRNCEKITAEIRGRGNASWNFPKKSYKIKFSEKVNLLGIGECKNKDWVLISCYGDQSMLRNYAACRLGQLLDGIEYSPSCTYAEVYLNGEYLGVYLVTEQVEEKVGRVESDKSGKDALPAEKDYLIELDMYASGEYGVEYIAVGGKPYTIKSDVTPDEGKYIEEFMTEVNRAVMSGERDGIEALIDMGSLTDTFVLQEFSKNIDAGWSSMFMQIKADGRLYFTAPWDFDLAFGNDDRLDNGDSDKLYAGVGRDGFSQNNTWFIKLWSCGWFREEVSRRWSELGGALDTVYEETRELGEKLAGAMERNYQKWKIITAKTHQQPASVLRCTSYEEHVEYLLNWYVERREYLDSVYN